MIKLNWKLKIISALFIGFLYVGMLMLFDYFSDEKSFSLNNLIFQGISFGALIGLGLPFAFEKLGNRVTANIDHNIQSVLTEDENIEIDGPANLFRGMESVGGKLFLTNKKMIFKSHKMNIQNGQTDIPYENIMEVIKTKTAKLIDNGLRIKANDGNEFDFVVNERAKWLEKLNEKIKNKTSSKINC